MQFNVIRFSFRFLDEFLAEPKVHYKGYLHFFLELVYGPGWQCRYGLLSTTCMDIRVVIAEATVEVL